MPAAGADGSWGETGGLQDVWKLPGSRQLSRERYILRFGRDGIDEFDNLFVINTGTGEKTPVQGAKNILCTAILQDGSYGILFNYEHDFSLFPTDTFKLGTKMQLMPKYPNYLYEAMGAIYRGDAIKKLTFSPDGRYLLIVGAYEESGKALVRVYEIDWKFEQGSDPLFKTRQ